MEDEKLTCPHCGNTECLKKDDYCFNCGKALHNYCTNLSLCPFAEDGSFELEANMVFCPACGSLSTFAQNDYICTQDF